MLEVMEAVEGGSAGEAGLSAGDKILRVDGTPVTEIGFEGAIERIRGRPGTTVQLSIQKHGSGETVELSIPRRKVRL
jgi:carboxyl-terminal processing protease